jgi:hypothetical protein
MQLGHAGLSCLSVRLSRAAVFTAKHSLPPRKVWRKHCAFIYDDEEPCESNSVPLDLPTKRYALVRKSTLPLKSV